MNLLSRRTLARAGAGAVALFAATAVAGVASPAYADDPFDLRVQLTGEAIAPASLGKSFIANVTNFGPNSAPGLIVEFDLAELDTAKVTASAAPGLDCTTTADTITCTVPDPVEKDGTEKVPVVLTPVAGQTGEAGSLTARTKDTADAADEQADSATVAVRIGASGADLIAVAFDVYALDDAGERKGPVAPDGVAPLLNFALNDGDKAVDSWQSVTQLPEHVTFVEHYENCTYSADNRTETCTFEDNVEPGGGFDLTIDVKVSANAPGPVNLTDGNLTVTVLKEAQDMSISSNEGSAIGERIDVVKGDEKILDNVDSSDNSDAFTVFVAAKAAGSGGSLPITGVQVGVIGAVGVAIVAVGGALLLLSRRRRIVTVAPDDESTGE